MHCEWLSPMSSRTLIARISLILVVKRSRVYGESKVRLELILLTLFFSCSLPQDKVIESTASRSSTITPLSQDFEDISEIIKIQSSLVLEETEEKILYDVEKVIKIDSQYFVYDKTTRTVTKYDFRGSFIGFMGVGTNTPDQHGDFSDVEFRAADSTLMLLSRNRQKVYEYSINGEYKGLISLDFYASSFTCLKNSFLYYTNYSPDIQAYNVWVTSGNHEIIGRFFPFDHTRMNAMISFAGGICGSSTHAYINNGLTDTIFSYEGSTMFPSFIFDFRSLSVPQRFRHDFKSILDNFREFTKFRFLRSGFLVSNDYLVYSVGNEGNIRTGIYNRNSGKNYTFSRSSFKNPLERIISFNAVGLSSSENNVFFFYIDPEILTKDFLLEYKDELQILDSEFYENLFSILNTTKPLLLQVKMHQG